MAVYSEDFVITAGITLSVWRTDGRTDGRLYDS